MPASNFRAGAKSLVFRPLHSSHPFHFTPDYFVCVRRPRRLVVSLLYTAGLGDSRRQKAEAVRCVGVQSGKGEGPAAVFGESHGEAGGPAGVRPSLALQISRRV